MQKMEFITKVMSQGRLTIPNEIRKVLGIKTGNYVHVTVEKLEREAAKDVKTRR